jgi:hypothetical protein
VFEHETFTHCPWTADENIPGQRISLAETPSVDGSGGGNMIPLAAAYALDRLKGMSARLWGGGLS